MRAARLTVARARLRSLGAVRRAAGGVFPRASRRTAGFSRVLSPGGVWTR